MYKKIIAVTFFLFLLINPVNTFAAESIKNFQTKITASQNGDMLIVETIDYDFGNANRHGIFRFIPTFTKLKDADLYRVSEIKFNDIKRDGKNEKYETNYESAKVEVKIGDPDKTIRGVHQYQITYTVKNGIASNFETHDEIYWNITGNDWEIPIENASAEITTDFNAQINNAACFTGLSGSTAKECNADITNSKATFNTTDSLRSGEGLTIVTSFPVNTFPKSQLTNNPPTFDPDFITFLKIYAGIWLILNLLVSPLIYRWYQNKKNKEKYGKPAVNFEIPKDSAGNVIPPYEAGIIDNTKLEQNDVMATLFDLAIRKFIKIEQIKKKKTLGIFGGGDEYQIKKLKDYTNLVSDFEQTLLDKLLNGKESRKLSEVKTFYTTFTTLERISFVSLVEKQYYLKNPKNQKAAFLVFGLISTFTANIILGLLLIYLSTKLNGRTKEGDRIDWQLEGLKIFLKNMKRHYNFQVKNAITVEKYIPYAMAFGFIEEFMDQLKEIDPNYKPSWYSGHTNFYAAHYGMMSSMQSQFTTTAPSSSSGFSGGSSGGGGGGGGGGSW